MQRISFFIITIHIIAYEIVLEISQIPFSNQVPLRGELKKDFSFYDLFL